MPRARVLGDLTTRRINSTLQELTAKERRGVRRYSLIGARRQQRWKRRARKWKWKQTRTEKRELRRGGITS